MQRPVYRFTFQPSVDMADVESSLVMSFLSAESLLGESQVQMDAAHRLNTGQRVCVIDASTRAGRTVCRLFTGYLRREYPEQFHVERLLDSLRV